MTNDADTQLNHIYQIVGGLMHAYEAVPTFHTVAPYMSLMSMWLAQEDKRRERMHSHGDSLPDDSAPG